MLEQLDRIRGYATELLYRRLSLAGGEHLGALAPNSAVTLVGASYLTGEADAEEVLARVLEHARSGVLWFTYRRGFAAIAGTSFTSDAGWGCMMRTGQMLLAQALAAHHFGRAWRSVALDVVALAEAAAAAPAAAPAPADGGGEAAAPAPAPAADDGDGGSGEAATREARAQEASLLALFADCAEAPFGIHQIVLEGAAQGTPAGRWLGPTSIAQVLGRLNARAVAAPSPPPPEAGASDAAAAPAPAPALRLELSVHVAMDGSVYRSEVEAAAGTGDGGGWRPLLLLVPLRLGLDRLNEEYVPSLRALLGMPQSVGMIGGRPRRSYYFLGCQGERVLYLDPHEVQPALRADAPQLPSCHFAQPPRTMPMREIDPSLALGFLCPTAAAFDDLCARCADAFAGSLPAFSIATAPPDFSRLSGGEEEGEGGDDDDGVVL